VGAWRDGRRIDVPVTLSVPGALVPAHSHDAAPEWHVYAGLMFAPLSAAYLKSQYGAEWSRCDLSWTGLLARLLLPAALRAQH
jgi:hypothetical protein